MKVKECTFGVARTINLGNYESLRLEHSVTVELSDGETVQHVRDEAFEQMRQTINAEYLAFQKKKG